MTGFNPGASPVGLYDMVSPSAPAYLNTRNAIVYHRDGIRNPVSFAPGSASVVVE